MKNRGLILHHGMLVTLLLSLTVPLPAEEPLVVATKVTPPFVFKAADGTWSGPSIELWEAVAAEQELTYRLEEMPLAEMLDAVERGSVDVAVGAVSVSEEREARFDFSHPFHTTGLGIAVQAKSENEVVAILSRLLSLPFLKAIALLILVLFLVGVVIHILERRGNPEQFGGGFWSGIGSGFWWSAVTMSTVGYGDKSPRTVGGRVFALVWMFTALITVSSFIAAITSSLTTEQLAAINEPSDLSRARIGTVTGSSSAQYLKQKRLRAVPFTELEQTLAALVDGTVDVIVYDLPLLRHTLDENPDWKLELLPYTLNVENYAFALPAGSALREPINRSLLKVVNSIEWQEKLSDY